MKPDKKFKERLKFYADTGRERNKLYCWQLPNGILSISDALNRFFAKGWNIRAAWYEKIDLSTGQVIENSRIDVAIEMDKYIDAILSSKQ
jgi:hypothetical protein